MPDVHTLHILTPCARPQLLHACLSSITHAAEHPFEIQWHVFFKGPVKDPGGQKAHNAVLKALPKNPQTWVINICDDNMLHPNQLKKAGDLIELHPDKKCFLFAQERRDNPQGCLPAVPEGIHPGFVDAAQAFVRTDLIGNTLMNQSPTSDGEFLEELYKKDKNSFLFVNDGLYSYHEAAFWFTGGGEKKERYWNEGVIKSILAAEREKLHAETPPSH